MLEAADLLNLDPRNFGVLQSIEGNYATLGRYAEQQVWLDRILALEPNDTGEPDAVRSAIGCEKFYGGSHDAVIRVYDEAGNVIETHEHTGGLKGGFVTQLGKRHARA